MLKLCNHSQNRYVTYKDKKESISLFKDNRHYKHTSEKCPFGYYSTFLQNLVKDCNNCQKRPVKYVIVKSIFRFLRLSHSCKFTILRLNYSSSNLLPAYSPKPNYMSLQAPSEAKIGRDLSISLFMTQSIIQLLGHVMN